MNIKQASPTTHKWSRRSFLAGAACALATAGCATTSRTKLPEAIDCHTHFYDPTRKEGVPWPSPKETKLYRRVLPPDYKALAQPLGITGTIVVEASEWVTDNDWLLDLANREPFIRGIVGNLPVGEPLFADYLSRLSLHPLFRGIRLRGQVVSRLTDETVVRDLRMLAAKELSLDLNGGPGSLPAVARLAQQIPELRIMINHVANLQIDGGAPLDAWMDGIGTAAGHANVYCKVSGLVEGRGQRGGSPSGADFYRPVLDHIWTCFGDRRLVFGSNWPVSENFAELKTVHGIVTSYFSAKGEPALSNVLAGNSRRFYRWS